MIWCFTTLPQRYDSSEIGPLTPARRSLAIASSFESLNTSGIVTLAFESESDDPELDFENVENDVPATHELETNNTQHNQVFTSHLNVMDWDRLRDSGSCTAIANAEARRFPLGMKGRVARQGSARRASVCTGRGPR